MQDKFLARWGAFAARNPGKVILVMLVLVILAIISASGLKMKMHFTDVLPLQDPKVREFERITKEYSMMNTIVVIQGDEQKIKAYADYIVPQIEELDDYVKRIDYKIETDFTRNHGLMLVKEKDLKNMKNIFSDLSLLPFIKHTNDNFEKTYIVTEESLSSKEKENNAVRALDGLQKWIGAMQDFTSGNEVMEGRAEKAVDDYLIGEEYYLSQDKNMLIVMVEPNFDGLDMEKVLGSTKAIQKIVDEALTNHPGITAGLAGSIPLNHDEMVFSEKDMQLTSIVAFALVILLFIISFRMVAAPVLAGINLIVAVILSAGTVALFLDALNMMTSMFAVILIGLGIDFAVHIISHYLENKSRGDDSVSATSKTLFHSGLGIIIGGVTTSIAFLTLMISKTKGIYEMGFVLGVGVVVSMLSTVILLPALLNFRDRMHTKLSKKSKPKVINPVDFKFLGHLAAIIERRPVISLLITVAISGVLLWQAMNVEFDYNYLNMEPKGLLSIALQDSMIEAYDMSPDYVAVSTNSIEDARKITEKAKKVKAVGMVSSISDYLPSADQQSRRIEQINEINDFLKNNTGITLISEDNFDELVDEMLRLEANIYEMGQMAYLGGQSKVEKKVAEIIGDPEAENSNDNIVLALVKYLEQNRAQVIAGLNEFQKKYEPAMRKTANAMANTERLTLANIDSSILRKFANMDNSSFLVSIYPKQQVYDLEFITGFKTRIENIDENITGVPLMFFQLIKLVGADGRLASAFALIIIFLLLWFSFKSVKYAIYAMIPLIMGTVWMIGLLHVFGFKLTIVNVMGIPMIIGIGIDDGVHILNRYRTETRDKIKRALSSTGKAVLLTSLTTMAGFGSLTLAQYRGFVSLGIILLLGVGACFFTTVLFLPALLSFDKKNK